MVEKSTWYDIVDTSECLLQGDFINACPVIIPPKEVSESETVSAEVIQYDVVVMSQSCDLMQKKLDLVLVCPVWPMSQMESQSAFFAGSDGKERLRQGNVPGYHLLNECLLERFESEYQVVDFRAVYSVPFEFITGFAESSGPRKRLLSPYREHLSQAFARFFMRVGLPTDIPPFK